MCVAFDFAIKLSLYQSMSFLPFTFHLSGSLPDPAGGAESELKCVAWLLARVKPVYQSSISSKEKQN